jgi:hypothetical protein
MAIAMQQLNKFATLLEPLLGSGQCTTMEVLLEAVFPMDPLQGQVTQPTELVQYSILELRSRHSSSG